VGVVILGLTRRTVPAYPLTPWPSPDLSGDLGPLWRGTVLPSDGPDDLGQRPIAALSRWPRR